jgi:hypothetical protein
LRSRVFFDGDRPGNEVRPKVGVFLRGYGKIGDVGSLSTYQNGSQNSGGRSQNKKPFSHRKDAQSTQRIYFLQTKLKCQSKIYKKTEAFPLTLALSP